MHSLGTDGPHISPRLSAAFPCIPRFTEAHRRLLDQNDHGVIATKRSDGRPRQSVVYCARDGERLLISTTKEKREMKVEDDERRANRRQRVRHESWARSSPT